MIKTALDDKVLDLYIQEKAVLYINTNILLSFLSNAAGINNLGWPKAEMVYEYPRIALWNTC